MKRVRLLVLGFLVLGGCHDPSVSGETWISLEFTVAAQSVVAGTTVGYTAELVAESGVRVTVSPELVSDIEAGLSYTANNLTPTLMGTHTLTATATHEGFTLSAQATLEVTPGAPAGAELTLSDETPDIDQRITATLTILDSSGNALPEEPWTLVVTAEPGTDQSSVVIEGHILTFTQEGYFTATGTSDTSGLSDSFGPFVVDSFAPILNITNPERGAWRTTETDTVQGTVTDNFSDIASTTVNGTAVTLDTSGGFSHPVTYTFGTNMIETIAADAGGSTTTDRRAVLHGDFNPRSTGIGEGIVARVNESTIEGLEGFAEDIIESYDIGAMIHDPMVDMENEECVWGICVTTYALRVRVRNVRLGSVDIELDPLADGSIRASGTIHNVSLNWDATGTLLEVDMSGDGTITADSVAISMRLTPTVSGGQVHIAVSDVNVTSEGFVFDWDSWIYDVMDFFSLDLSGTVQGYVEDAIRDAVTTEVPALLESSLQDLELAASFDIFGNSYTLAAEPDALSVDDLGITLSLATTMTPAEWRSTREGEGSLYASYTPPELGDSPGLIASFSQDFLNQALAAFWGGGLLTQELDVDTLGFDPSMLGLLLPELADAQVFVINGLLPPVVLPSDGDALGVLQIGDLQVDIHSGDPSDPSTLLLRMYVGLTADLSLEVTPDATLAANITNVTPWFDVTEPVLPADFETGTEELLVTLVPMLLGQITDALGTIPIPDISGFSMTDVSVEAAGAEDGYVNISGELTGL